MDKTDIIARLIQAVERPEGPPLVFAACGLGPDMETPARPLIECYLVERGAWSVDLPGHHLEVQAGDLLICNAHFGSRGRSQDPAQRHSCVSLAIDDQPVLQDLGRAPLAVQRTVTPNAVPQLQQAFRGAEIAFGMRAAAFAGSRCRAAVLHLLIGIADALGRVGPGDDLVVGGVAERIMAWIARQPLGRELASEALTSEVGLGLRHCNRLFTAAYGCTPRQQHLRLRMERARFLLERGSLSVQQVAAMVGFADPLYFSRRFRAATGCSPRNWQARHRG